MRRLALLAVVGLAGCGHNTSPKPEPTPTPVVAKKKTDVDRKHDEAMKAVDESTLPKDAKQELHEAQELVDSQN